MLFLLGVGVTVTVCRQRLQPTFGAGIIPFPRLRDSTLIFDFDVVCLAD
jgi:hypothetical protein